MSFSSDSSLNSTSSSITSSSPQHDSASAPPQKPKYSTLESLLLSLILLARQTYLSYYSSSSATHQMGRIAMAAADYTKLHGRIATFFAKNLAFDFVADATFGYCLELRALLRLIEYGLPAASLRSVQVLDGLVQRAQLDMDARDWRSLQKRVNTDVEYLVFRGSELDCERLPWNLAAVGNRDE